MTFRKRIISICLIALIFITYLPELTFAEGIFASGTCGTCEWVIDSNGLLTIYEGTLSDWGDSLPEWLEGYRSSMIQAVTIRGNVKALTCRYMFYGCRRLTALDLSDLNTSSVTDMSNMFAGCSKLTSLIVSNFDTSSVINMSCMFASCGGLTTLDVSSFDTSSVTDMSGMFGGCSGLTSLNVNNFDTSSVTDMSGMFCGCSATSLDLSSFDTSNVTDMSSMFGGCSGLTSLNVSSFDTSAVTDMSGMFSCCSVTSLDLSSFDTSNVTDMSSMFNMCNELTSLNVSFDTSAVTCMESMFDYCYKINSLDLSSFNTGKTVDFNKMFFCCTNLESLDLSGFDTRNAANLDSMFAGCAGLTSLDISGFCTNNVTSVSMMFYGCSSLKNLDLSNCDFSKINSSTEMMSGMTLDMLRTPLNVIGDIALPHQMATNRGKTYTSLPKEASISVILYRTTDEPANYITRDLLFGEYSKFLNNKTYKAICGKISGKTEEIIWKNSNMTFSISALKSCLAAGGVRNLKTILGGAAVSDRKLEEQIAKECLLNAQGDGELWTDVIDSSRITKQFSDIKRLGYSIPATWYKSTYYTEEVAKEIAEATGKDIKIVEEEINNSKQYWKKASNYFKAMGYAFDILDMAIMTYETEVILEQNIDFLIRNIREDTALYNGLKALKKKKEGGLITSIAADYARDEVLDFIAGQIIDNAIDITGEPIVFWCDMAFRIASWSMTDVNDINDYKRLAICDSNNNILESAMWNKYSQIVQMYQNNQGVDPILESEYELIFRMKLASLEESVKYALKVASDEDAEELRAMWDMYKGYLTYNKYIESCLYNANLSYIYGNGNNNSIVIKGVISNSSDSGKKGGKNRAKAKDVTTGALDYMLDIPETIDGLTVEGVDEEAFMSNSDIGYVHVPDGVTLLGDNAFADCANLKEVFLPFSVNSIGDNVFSGNADIVVNTSSEIVAEKLANEGDAQVVAETPKAVRLVVVSNPEKLTYKPNEAVDTSGLKVNALLENGTTQDVSDIVSCNISERTPGDRFLRVYYDDLTADIPITISSDECSYSIVCIDGSTDKVIEVVDMQDNYGAEITPNPPKIDGYVISESPEGITVFEGAVAICRYRKEIIASLADASIELPESLPYTGEPQYASIKVKIGNHVLVEDEDYAAYYSDCTDVGDVTISIFGIGRYDGEISSTYKIVSDDKEKPVAPVSETDTKVDTKTPSKTEVGTIHEFGGNTVQILSANTVAFTKAENKRSVTVPATVTIDNRTFMVVQVNANAFTAKKIRTVTIGENVSIIMKNAFAKSKATKMILKTKLLNKSTVKSSLKGSKIKRVNVKVGKKKDNKTYLKKYKKIFTKKNAGKKVSVK